MKWAAFIGILFLAGCGGSDGSGTTAADTTTTETTDAVAVVQATSPKLSKALRQTAALADRQDCGDEERLRTLSGQITAHIRTLEKVKDDPALKTVRAQLLDAVTSARKGRNQAEEVLVAC